MQKIKKDQSLIDSKKFTSRARVEFIPGTWIFKVKIDCNRDLKILSSGYIT